MPFATEEEIAERLALAATTYVAAQRLWMQTIADIRKDANHLDATYVDALFEAANEKIAVEVQVLCLDDTPAPPNTRH